MKCISLFYLTLCLTTLVSCLAFEPQKEEPLHTDDNPLPSIIMDSLPSGELHLLQLACTDDSALGEGFQSNTALMRNLFKYWAEQAGMEFKQTVIQGGEANSEQLWESLEDIQADSNDILVFYYSGHAINTGEGNIWPDFLIHAKGGNRPNMLDIHKKIKSKKARLTMSFADCCNYFKERRYLSKTTAHITKESGDGCEKQAELPLQQLLRQGSGDLIVCSSSPGEYAFTERQLGGIFTNKFANTIFNKMEYGDSSSWEGLMRHTDKQVQAKMQEIEKQQTTQYLINIKL